MLTMPHAMMLLQVYLLASAEVIIGTPEGAGPPAKAGTGVPHFDGRSLKDQHKAQTRLHRGLGGHWTSADAHRAGAAHLMSRVVVK